MKITQRRSDIELYIYRIMTSYHSETIFYYKYDITDLHLYFIYTLLFIFQYFIKMFIVHKLFKNKNTFSITFYCSSSQSYLEIYV